MRRNIPGKFITKKPAWLHSATCLNSVRTETLSLRPWDTFLAWPDQNGDIIVSCGLLHLEAEKSKGQ